MAKKLPKCKTCSIQMRPWGKTSNGRKRYRCSRCKKSQIYHQRATSNHELRGLFRQYVLWGTTYAALSSISGYSIEHLARTFHEYLLEDPPDLPRLIQEKGVETYLLIDGLWFGRWFVLLVYRQSKTLRILRITVCGREAASKIIKDLKKLQEEGYIFTAVVSDGGKGIVNAVTTVFPHKPHQICLAHMHRDVISSIGRYPKDYRVKLLKRLADHVWLIESKEALRWWEQQIQIWVKKYYPFMNETKWDTQGHWWYIHKGVRRAVGILLRLPATSFVFLTHPLMPKTTNELEAQFGHIAHRWLSHRGLKKERWHTFLKWFVYYYNTDRISLS